VRALSAPVDNLHSNWAYMVMTCQIVRAGRRLIYRVLAYRPYLPIFFRLCAALRC